MFTQVTTLLWLGNTIERYKENKNVNVHRALKYRTTKNKAMETNNYRNASKYGNK